MDEVQEWIESDDMGYEHLSDEQIVEEVQQLHSHSTLPDETESEEECESVVHCPINNTEAMLALDTALNWLQHQPEASTYNTSVLRSSRDLAAKKRFSQLKQTNITSFYSSST